MSCIFSYIYHGDIQVSFKHLAITDLHYQILNALQRSDIYLRLLCDSITLALVDKLPTGFVYENDDSSDLISSQRFMHPCRNRLYYN